MKSKSSVSKVCLFRESGLVWFSVTMEPLLRQNRIISGNKGYWTIHKHTTFFLFINKLNFYKILFVGLLFRWKTMICLFFEKQIKYLHKSNFEIKTKTEWGLYIFVKIAMRPQITRKNIIWHRIMVERINQHPMVHVLCMNTFFFQILIA